MFFCFGVFSAFVVVVMFLLWCFGCGCVGYVFVMVVVFFLRWCNLIKVVVFCYFGGMFNVCNF